MLHYMHYCISFASHNLNCYFDLFADCIKLFLVLWRSCLVFLRRVGKVSNTFAPGAVAAATESLISTCETRVSLPLFDCLLGIHHRRELPTTSSSA
jgi:hypothetical protein